MASTERRHHPRRARSIRLRFAADGDEHRAVTTNVSAAGAFVKASHVPRVGATLTFREVYHHGGSQVLLRAEVVWAFDEPTLDRPDTGFGVRLLEVATPDDPAGLEDLLRTLGHDRATQGPISFEERPSGAFAVYRFGRAADTPQDPAAALRPEARADGDDLEGAEPLAVDLARELDRLEREHAPRPLATPPPPAAPTQAAPSAPAPRERTRRRSVTGIFTALFSRRRDPPPEAPPGPSAAAPDLDPDLDEELDALEPGTHRVAVTWAGGGVAEAALHALDRHAVTLRAASALPPAGSAVRFTLVDPEGRYAPLPLQATVRARAATPVAGVSEYTLALAPPTGALDAGALEGWIRRLQAARGPR